jgi:serine phosphatase RsbU (regulator of sigma subunit)/anti-sigma regulatory factor (Ser/Thr protein kinase)
LVAAARRYLPEGGTLSDESWATRHGGILVLLWLHAVAIPVFALLRGFTFGHVLVESATVPVLAFAASWRALPRRGRTMAASLGLLSSSALLVHISGGLIEMHFHFFVMVVVVSLYQDWLPFIAAIAYVFLHHGLLGLTAPASVFNHPDAIAHPWKWAGIHAFFIAGISAASLVNWRLNETYLAHRRRAEERLRQESRIVERLNEVGQMLGADLELDHVVKKVTDVATELTAAEFGAFFYNVRDQAGDSYLLYTLSGVEAEAFAGSPMPRATAIFAPTFAGEGVVRLDDVTADPRYGLSAPYHGMPPGHLPVRSYLAVPVISRGDIIGGLFFGHAEPGRFGEDDERIAVGIAAHAAIAVQNARLYDAERRAREEEGAARQRLAIVAEAGRRLLASPLDVDAVLTELATLVVPTVADGCVVHVAHVDGSIRQVSSATAAEFTPTDGFEPLPETVLGESHPVVQAIRTGRSELIVGIADSDIDAAITDPEHRRVARSLAPTSALVVPLVGRERVHGTVLMTTFAASGRMLGEDDVALGDELARRAAAAVENAWMFAGQREAAETLQHALLPESLPVFPGVELASRYVAGGPGAEVGGDWYDAIPLTDGTVGLAMGDVVGRGIAAASLMGQLRNALRAYALDGHGPAEAVSRLNTFLHELGPSSKFATLLYAVLDHERGTLRFTNAGHPPPLVLHPDGSAAYVEVEAGVPLGAIVRTSYEEHEIAVPPGSTVLLYTDGLVEDRSTGLDVGLGTLRRGMEEGPDDLERLCDHVLARGLRGRVAQDDTALLAVRCVRLGDHVRLSLPAQPATLRSIRMLMRRWLREVGASDQDAFEVVVATVEACANVIRHSGSAAASFDLDLDRNGQIEVVVRNCGRWREGRSSAEGGRGLGIMHELMDEVRITKGPPETVVIMRRVLTADDDGGR